VLLEKHRAAIEHVLSRYPPERKRSAVLPILALAQQEYGYCSPEAMKEVAGILDLEPT